MKNTKIRVDNPGKYFNAEKEKEKQIINEDFVAYFYGKKHKQRKNTRARKQTEKII